MTHVPDKALGLRLQQAREQVAIGALYVHYKSPDKTYRVISHVIIEATDEAGIVYQAEYGSRIVFMRPLASWLELAHHQGRSVPRFKRVDEPKAGA